MISDPLKDSEEVVWEGNLSVSRGQLKSVSTQEIF